MSGPVSAPDSSDCIRPIAATPALRGRLAHTVESLALAPPGTSRQSYLLCAFLGLGGLVAGATGPLLSNYVPLLVEDLLGERRTAIGAVMAIDNVLLLLLVPWSGALSDRASAQGRGRRRIVVAGLVLTAMGTALLPFVAALGLAGLVSAIVILYAGLNVQRSPFQALVADLVPSRHRPLAVGSVTLQMCIGAIVFLMLGSVLGMRPAFVLAAATVLGVALAYAFWLREPAMAAAGTREAAFPSLFEAAAFALRGTVPGMRAVFVATLFLQLTFQSFTTWFALHGTARFGVSAEEVTVGFIAWAVGGALGAIPAGAIGVRIGRRNALLLGFGLMGATLLALDRVATLAQAVPLLALASACWALPTVNAFPLFVEPIPTARRGVLVALFLLCAALGGAVGDPVNGRLFDLLGGYRGALPSHGGVHRRRVRSRVVHPRRHWGGRHRPGWPGDHPQ